MRRIAHFALLLPLSALVAAVEYFDHGEPLSWAFRDAWEHSRGG